MKNAALLYGRALPAEGPYKHIFQYLALRLILSYCSQQGYCFNWRTVIWARNFLTPFWMHYNLNLWSRHIAPCIENIWYILKCKGNNVILDCFILSEIGEKVPLSKLQQVFSSMPKCSQCKQCNWHILLASKSKWR